jgi:phosphatidylinositol alpha-1,6-mannosyltransferase
MPLRVLTVCRLVPEKGVEDLVVAARLLADRGVDVVVTFAGSGPEAAHLADMAAKLGVADRIVFTGSVPYDQIPGLYAEADVFVLASAPRATWQEQFGFAVVEAMASGLPVLAGDSGSLDDVVGDPQQLVTPQYPGRLADALQRLAADPARREALGSANRTSAEQRYDRDVVAGRILAFYEAALSTASASSMSA